MIYISLDPYNCKHFWIPCIYTHPYLSIGTPKKIEPIIIWCYLYGVFSNHLLRYTLDYWTIVLKKLEEAPQVPLNFNFKIFFKNVYIYRTFYILSKKHTPITPTSPTKTIIVFIWNSCAYSSIQIFGIGAKYFSNTLAN